MVTQSNTILLVVYYIERCLVTKSFGIAEMNAKFINTSSVSVGISILEYAIDTVVDIVLTLLKRVLT